MAEEIDFERVVHDAAYRRSVIKRLNGALPSEAGGTPRRPASRNDATEAEGAEAAEG